MGSLTAQAAGRPGDSKPTFMAPQLNLDDSTFDTNGFYRRTLHVLGDAQVPFLVGGSHAFLHYTGIVRETKDFDLFVRRGDLDRALSALAGAGYRTELTFPHWLAKAVYGDDFVDLVFNSGNGICAVDDEWFEHAVEADVLGLPVKLMPAEELMWQKAYIMDRERFDGADVMHLLVAASEKLDWDRLARRFGDHWRLLLAHLVLFQFTYPSEAHRVPATALQPLLERFQREVPHAGSNGDGRTCYGTLLSRGQFLVDIGRWGFRDARLPPTGSMRGEDVAYWTWAIDNVR